MAQGSLWLESRSFGVMDGPPPLTFGEIADVTADANGRIYVLDRFAREIRVFTPDGVPLQTVGRRGEGPGEYVEPTALVVTEDALLLAADEALGRMTVYEITDSLRYRSSFQLDVHVQEMCRFGNAVYALGFAHGALIHEFTVFEDSIRRERSFGAPFSDHPILRRYGDYIACLTTADLLVVAGEELPRIRAHSRSTGAVAWEVALRGFSGLAVTPLANGSVSYALPEGQSWYHWILGLVSTVDGNFGIQVGTVRDAAYPDTASEISIRLFSARGIEGRAATTTFRVHAVLDSLVYGVRSIPYPQVVVGAIPSR